jgi:TATA-box binding protein (TBP) (component of TFIID and TFIIIB)
MASLKRQLRFANIVATGSVSKQGVHLYRFAQMAEGCGLDVWFEPELQNYAKVDFKDHAGRRIGSACIFASGKANFMGFKSVDDVNAAFDQLKAALKTMNEREEQAHALAARIMEEFPSARESDVIEEVLNLHGETSLHGETRKKKRAKIAE